MMRKLFTMAAVALFAVWVVALRPTFLGGPASYIIVSGHSMEPTFYTGDLAILQRQDTYHKGDIIAYRLGGESNGIVIHRIVGGTSASGFVTRGDNNSWDDPWRPKPADILGKLWIHWPGAGNTLDTLRQPRYFSTLVSVMTVLTLLGGSEVQRRRRRRKGANSVTQTKRKTLTGRMPAPLWMILAGSVTVVLTLAGLTGFIITTLQPAQQSRKVTQATYTDTATYSYTVRLRPSLLYPTGAIGPIAPSSGGSQVSEQPIPTRLVKAIDLALAYQFRGDSSATGDLSANLVIQADSSWSKTLPLLPDTPFSGGKIAANMTLNMVQIISIINTISQQTGIVPTSFHLLVTPTIHVHGVVGGNALTETYTPTYTLQMDPQQITMGQNLAQSETRKISTTVIEPSSVTWLGVRLALAQARQLSALALLFGVLGLVVLGAIYTIMLARDESLRIHVRYGSLLVTVAEARRDAATRIVKLASIHDLERLAKRGEGVIFWQRVSPTSYLYFVEDERAMYAYPIGDAAEMSLDSPRPLSLPDPLSPSVVEAERDSPGRARADVPRGGRKFDREGRDRDGQRQIEDSVARDGLRGAGEVAPVGAMLGRFAGTLPVEIPNETPSQAQVQMLAAPAFVRETDRPELDLRLGDAGRDHAEAQGELLSQAVYSVESGYTWYGRGLRLLPSGLSPSSLTR